MTPICVPISAIPRPNERRRSSVGSVGSVMRGLEAILIRLEEVDRAISGSKSLVRHLRRIGGNGGRKHSQGATAEVLIVTCLILNHKKSCSQKPGTVCSCGVTVHDPTQICKLWQDIASALSAVFFFLAAVLGSFRAFGHQTHGLRQLNSGLVTYSNLSRQVSRFLKCWYSLAAALSFFYLF